MRKYNLSLKRRIKAINVRTLDGRVVASPNSSEIGRDVSGETFFIKGKDAATITEVDVGYG